MNGEYKKPTKFQIPRSTWLHGEGNGDSYLLRKSDGKMCCLGNYGLAIGLSKEDIVGLQTLSQVATHTTDLELLKLLDLSNADRLMVVNDYRGISKTQKFTSQTRPGREAEIISLFKEDGIEVEFID